MCAGGVGTLQCAEKKELFSNGCPIGYPYAPEGALEGPKEPVKKEITKWNREMGAR